ncbi:hypothetical protein LLH06_19420 [Mucilaginibacter daejeonensis]|uniref:hypothetical protein n=1 Tax=Mucilaginibacter daejeonensis TaxID=398049 RepID=UPI001D175ADC|nr:hypothetical protein [Mucilaginibacter daejeonensis]UEG53118.1 hypothetical protein LLH06_19420 [Mucilaginibacter daejeonensis]
MKKNYLLSVFTILLIGSVSNVYAGWPIGKYRHIFTPSFTYYTSKNQWDQNGNKINGGNGSRFNAYSVGLYGGVGISRRADILASVNFTSQTSSIGGSRLPSVAGLGDATLGLSYNIAHWKYKRFLSVQGTVIAPLYTIKNTGNTLGYGVLGTEGKLMFAGELAGPSYFNAEAGFRHYFDEKGPNQIVASLTVGSALDKRKKHQLSADIGGISSYSTNRNLVAINPNLVYNGYYIKGSINYGYKFTNKFSIFGSGFTTLTGENAAQGSGFAVFAIFKF